MTRAEKRTMLRKTKAARLAVWGLLDATRTAPPELHQFYREAFYAMDAAMCRLMSELNVTETP